MIYSVHNPVTGAFEYWQGPPDIPINNDLPTPRWNQTIATKLGIPASLAARPLPAGSVRAGAGTLPKGMISSGTRGEWVGTKKGQLPSGMGSFSWTWSLGPLWPGALVAAGAGGLVALAGWYWHKNTSRRS